jgi:hypothetical protein
MLTVSGRKMILRHFFLLGLIVGAWSSPEKGEPFFVLIGNGKWNSVIKFGSY